MATKYGELFSDEYQKSLKEQFCYADTDPGLWRPALL